MNEKMQKTVKGGRRTRAVALVFFSVFWCLHNSNAPFRVTSMPPKRRALTEVELEDWGKQWLLELDGCLWIGTGEEILDKSLFGTVEAFAGTVASYNGSPVNVVQWINDTGARKTLDWSRGLFYGADSHPALINYVRPVNFVKQLGIFSFD